MSLNLGIPEAFRTGGSISYVNSVVVWSVNNEENLRVFSCVGLLPTHTSVSILGCLLDSEMFRENFSLQVNRFQSSSLSDVGMPNCLSILRGRLYRWTCIDDTLLLAVPLQPLDGRNEYCGRVKKPHRLKASGASMDESVLWQWFIDFKWKNWVWGMIKILMAFGCTLQDLSSHTAF